jgi:hypothetical protein
MLPSPLKRVLKRGPAPSAGPAPRVRPQVEQLEDRLVPALSVTDLTNPAVTPTTLVDTLTGGNNSVAVSNITYTGNNVAAGTFTGGNGIIGFNSGIVLSTGTAAGIVGPNNTGAFTGVHPNAPGDPDLQSIARGQTFDAAVLQFDITPTGNVLAFQYVFGSDEYNEFVNTQFNDVFGFFVNGVNFGVLPGTKTAVDINSVNLNKNSQFYINNAPAGDPFPATPPLLNTQMDGLTTVLPVVLSVNPGQTYHIKLAIANVSDHQFDSNVLIKANSLDAPTVRTFHPVRYVEELPTNPTPNPSTGQVKPSTHYDGNITLELITNDTVPGPLFVFFPDLPPGVTVVRPSGTTSSGAPFVALPNGAGLDPNDPVLRIPITLDNPDDAFMSTFLLGFTIDITGVPQLQ